MCGYPQLKFKSRFRIIEEKEIKEIYEMRVIES